MTSILLTGAAGMIGSVVLRRLEANGASVWTTDLRPLDREQHITADLNDPSAVRSVVEPGFDAVIHLSGAVGGSLDGLFTSNVLGTTRLLDALPDGSRVVVAGSAAEYGAGEGDPISEGDPLRPVSPYGWAKAAQSSIASSIAADRGHRLTVVRPFNVVGPNLPSTTAVGNMRKQLIAADSGTEVVVGRLDIVRDYVAVDFVASVFCDVAVDPDGPQVLNACSGVGILLHDVLDAMIAMLGIDVDVKSDPHLAGLSAASIVVGNPRIAIDRYGLETRPDAQEIARVALGHTSG